MKSLIRNSVNQQFIYRKRKQIYQFLSRDKVMVGITILPVFTLFVLINLFPIIWAIFSSFFRIPAFSPEWTWIGLENYRTVIADDRFHDALFRSVIFAGGSVILQLILGIALALVLNESFKYAKVIRAIAFLPYLIPTAILGFIALWMGDSTFGIVNQMMVQVGIVDDHVSWYGDADWVMPALIITNSWKFTIFVTIMVLARLQGIPEGLYEAATMSGASMYQKFWHITWPNIKGIVLIVLLLRSIWMFNKFDIIWILTRGGPGRSSETAPVYAYEVGFNQAKLGEAAAIATILFIMLLFFAIIYFFFFKPSKGVRVE